MLSRLPAIARPAFPHLENDSSSTGVPSGRLATPTPAGKGSCLSIRRCLARVPKLVDRSKQRWERETIGRRYRRYVRIRRRLRRMTDHAVRRSIDLQVAPRPRSSPPANAGLWSRAGYPLIPTRRASPLPKSWAWSGPSNSFTALMNAENSRSARRIPNTIVQLFPARASVVMQAEIQKRSLLRLPN